MNILPKRNPADKDGYKQAFFGAPFPAKQKSPWCEHSIDVSRTPDINCNQCWSFYFMNNAEFIKLSLDMLKANHEQRLVNDHGAKFVKKLKWFATAISKMEEVVGIMKERIVEEDLANGLDLTVDHDGIRKAIVEVVE